ncbi:MAG: hypothetical protein ABJF01_20805 [bacterium]
MSSMGCLFSLLILIAAVYVGIAFGKPYWRYYQFQDDVKQQIRFAAHTTNDQILLQLRAVADSLELPDAAKAIVIKRSDKAISIDVEYDERVVLPKYSRDLHFHPHAESPL